MLRNCTKKKYILVYLVNNKIKFYKGIIKMFHVSENIDSTIQRSNNLKKKMYH